MPDIELILQHDVESLGKMGDVVKVSPGYARNYLLPRRIGVHALPENLKRVTKLRARREAVEAKRFEEARELATKISTLEVKLEAATNETGQLYGSIGAREIVTALEKLGVVVSERDVRLDHPLKELGVFPVKVHLRGDISTELKVWIVESKK
ncbi:MAG: 50S ribosomal protein L9 [Planctomycetes bacterium]|nr:50S ribosomal protein L9 [Planctomycetota bacterium]